MIYYGIVENLNRDVITNVSGSTKGSSGFSVKGTGFVFGGGGWRLYTSPSPPHRHKSRMASSG